MIENPDRHRNEFSHAVDLFNQREFFACHDVLEELWSGALGNERNFLQGLIHAAVSLFHFEEGNLTGARKMHDSALRYLQSGRDAATVIDLPRFLQDYERCFQALLEDFLSYPAHVEIRKELIPRLYHLVEDATEDESPS